MTFGLIHPLARDFTLIAFHVAVTCGVLEVCIVAAGFGVWLEVR